MSITNQLDTDNFIPSTSFHNPMMWNRCTLNKDSGSTVCIYPAAPGSVVATVTDPNGSSIGVVEVAGTDSTSGSSSSSGSGGGILLNGPAGGVSVYTTHQGGENVVVGTASSIGNGGALSFTGSTMPLG